MTTPSRLSLPLAALAFLAVISLLTALACNRPTAAKSDDLAQDHGQTPPLSTTHHYTYDPTNGRTSEGDVYRVSSGPLQQESLPARARPAAAATTATRSPLATLAATLPPSTGGVNPVNGQIHDAMFFDHHGTNPFVDTDIDSLLTFGLDVDTASYTVARRFLQEGTMPPQDAVRVEEFLNYFNWQMASPREGAFAIHVDGAPSRFGSERHHLLRIGIRGREIEVAERADANLTFVIDTSGSMARENRLGLVKRALRLLVDQLRPTDQVAIVEYGSRARLIMPHRPVGERQEILGAIERLQSNGSTNAEEGLLVGYREASRVLREGAINRVILCSDGVANVGNTGADGILARISDETKRGITLTTVGFGMDNYNDVLMERLADEGDGMYAYVDTISEARRVFVENVTGTLEIIAREARAQIDFDPDVVRSYRLLGYENRDIADERFRDDTVDAGEIGAGHRVTVLVEVRLWEDAEGDLGNVHLRYGLPEGETFEEINRPIVRADIAPSFEAAAPSFRLAACVAETAEVLRGSHWAQDSDLDEVLREAHDAIVALDNKDGDTLEFLDLLARARELQSRDVPAGTGG